MSEAAPKCPTCGMAVPAGAVRCPQCGRVLGEQTPCPHCHAVAAVRRSGSGWACVACGKPRDVAPETVVLDEGRMSRFDQLAPRGASGGAEPGGALPRLLRLAGVLLIGAAVVAGGAAAAPGAPVLLLLLAAGGLAAAGVTSLRQSSGVERRDRERRARQQEQRVLALAEKRGGDLLATDVARELGIGLEEADALLTRLADGSRVSVEVDPEGIVHYAFREIAASRAPKVRVEPGEEAAALEDEAARRVERELGRRDRL